MKVRYLLVIVCVIALLAVSGYAASEAFSGKSVKGHFGSKEAYIEGFEAKAEAMDMTVEEFKEYLSEQYEAKAEAMGMTVSEFKEYLGQMKKGKKQFHYK